MNNFDADDGEAIACVKKIIENVRCATCDKLEGSRIRYPCGHTACDDCVIYEQNCQICTTPSQGIDSQLKPDYPLTHSLKNAVDLLKACQKLFGINAFQRKRISEQLRIEKELFPKCIQAPLKYENKRKNTSFSFKNKENRHLTFFPGEATSPVKDRKMENTVNYVHQWLNKNEKNLPRKPFTDLIVNKQYNHSPQNKDVLQNNTHKSTLSENRKRAHFKTTLKDYCRIGGNRKSSYKYDHSSKKPKYEIISPYTVNSSSVIQNKCDNDESGIFEDSGLVVIDDSQEPVIDKDKKAWHAVLEACKNKDLQSTSLDNSTEVNTTNDSNKLLLNTNVLETRFHIPFIKKSAISETCIYCRNELNSAKPVPVIGQNNPVKITIDNDSFVTTITILKNIQDSGDTNMSHSVSVQTDTCETYMIKNNDCIEDCKDDLYDKNESSRFVKRVLLEDKSINASDTQSEDLFADDRKILKDSSHRRDTSQCLIIEESDSDTDLEVSCPMSVKADVHRSCEESEYGALTEIVNVVEHETRPRRGPRGLTPTSTDSSEKENFNPNRIKRRETGKKKPIKK